jgi:hypothetical protein
MQATTANEWNDDATSTAYTQPETSHAADQSIAATPPAQASAVTHRLPFPPRPVMQPSLTFEPEGKRGGPRRPAPRSVSEYANQSRWIDSLPNSENGIIAPPI